MHLNYSKITCFTFLIVLVLILYQSLLNYMFGLIGLPYWKQLLPVMLFVAFSFCWLAKSNRIGFDPYSYSFSLFLIGVLYFLYGLFFAIDKMEGMVWVVYRFIGYLWFFIPVITLLNAQCRRNNAFLLVFVVCFSVALGLIADSVYDGWDYLKTVEIDQVSKDVTDIIDKRSSFFTGSSSNLFVILSLPLALSMSEKGAKLSAQVFIFCLFSIIAIYLSGSRFSLILMTFFVVMSFFWSGKKRAFKILFVIFVFFLALLSFFYLYDVVRDMRLFQVLDPEDPGNRGRLRYYFWFYENYFQFSPVNSVFGHGPGFLSGEANLFPSVHFESSAIMMLIETGLVGFFVFYVMFFFILFVSLKSGFLRLWVLLVALFTIFVPAFLSYQIMFCLGVAFYWDRRFIVNSDFKIKSTLCL